ncbi:hypothetical protein [Rhodococcus baikonurensis]|uniref:Uncharacterized protein n=1 Tax=Rhodococcus baikonurensis TaxID=172041 RepID=A0ABV5XS45_9NOCA
MSTISLVRLSTPTGSDDPEVVLLVHYDGDAVGTELAKMIARDGYPAVHSTFAQQPTRHWKEIFAVAGEAVRSEAEDLPVDGFGIAWIGEMLLTAEEIGDGSRWGWNSSYLVTPDGKVSHCK